MEPVTKVIYAIGDNLCPDINRRAPDTLTCRFIMPRTKWKSIENVGRALDLTHIIPHNLQLSIFGETLQFLCDCRAPKASSRLEAQRPTPWLPLMMRHSDGIPSKTASPNCIPSHNSLRRPKARGVCCALHHRDDSQGKQSQVLEAPMHYLFRKRLLNVNKQFITTIKKTHYLRTQLIKCKEKVCAVPTRLKNFKYRGL